ncbi:P-loop containing nucleoside triphosphate hydrolase protein [Immersiella caudata]|uniref:P-loop containing nucleoside triphosphate hydrolase protein n=1 Tax=Immersiella caudata TaxID=314043 RepID=A0AA39TL06_9PEZI|nr:P-loop containing nucleoside triphosphate hydrolase protein [Immersiella caudata]
MDHLEISKFPTRGHPLFAEIMAVLNGVLANHRHVQMLEGRTYQDGETQTFDRTLEAFISSSGLSTMLPYRRPRQLQLPCRSVLPHKNNVNFVGREDVLSQIYSALRPDKTDGPSNTQSVFVLCGLGGVGKTQIALRFAAEYMHCFQVVLFAHADKPESLLDDFVNFAVKLGLVDENEPDQLHSPTDIPWLLILDNADNPGRSLAKFRPASKRGAILFTTRAQSLAVEFGCQILPPLRQSEGIDLLIKLTGRQSIETSSTGTNALDDGSCDGQQEDREAAKQIVHRLGGLPLGIYSAALLIVNDCCSFTEFLAAYDYRDLFASAEDGCLFRDPNGGQYSHSLQTVWSMNFETLPEDSLHLLNVVSFFNPDTIELGMLGSGAETAFKAGESGWAFVSDPKKLIRQKGKLLKSSLLYQSHDNKSLSMHRLVQAACHQRMSSSERQRAFHKASRLLHHVWPVAPRKNRHRPDLWSAQGGLIQHVSSLCGFYEVSQREDAAPLVGTMEFAALLYNASWYNYERGTFENLEHLLSGAEHCCLQLDGCELILADIYGARASVATETNQPSLALENFKLQHKAIDAATSQGMITLPDIRFCFGLGGMGNGIHGMGLYQDAEQWYRKCLRAFEGLDADQRMYGGNLAFCLIWQGKLDEAQRVIDPIIKSAPDRGFRTGYIMYPLGNLQIAKGDLDSASKTHSDALKIYQQTLGDKHHRTADLFHKVAWHHHSRKEYARAVDLLNQALTIFNARPSWYRNERARTKYKLGCVLQDTGRLAEGTKLINEAEELRREILGAKVPPGEEKDFDSLVMFWSR